MHRLQHVTLIVDDIDVATDFYVRHFDFEVIEVKGLDYPGAFLRINDFDQLHLAVMPDGPTTFRGHFCLRIDNFSEQFFKFQRLELLDLKPWGKMRELPNGSVQMYVRDPAGNLVELTSHPEDRADIDPTIFNQPEWGGAPYSYTGKAG
ncbi:VOC family protein [Neolewinella antarctica]|uniref:Catechol 2,3-dioxygenase-like lactoylglutathione lyase family enzyme n=1 Tax=Neolewinella antarctica TaxID=442734 RepID=A0ABX0X7Y3_9BACT|nr:VOC family protein [Neolewinella antarctica]NJC24978.1 catechol 2,3-dioxygenase-like lactoylglutathione lyase family enzyme [Neolewinella antarctica]